MNKKLRYAIIRLQERVSGGVRLSELSQKQRRLVKMATRMGYVIESPIKGDWIVEPSGRQP